MKIPFSNFTSNLFCLLTAILCSAFPCAYSQDVSEPINMEDLIEPSPPDGFKGRLMPYLKRITNISQFDLVVILSPNDIESAEVIAFRRLPGNSVVNGQKPNDPSSPKWAVVYFPRIDDIRRNANKMIRFEGAVPDNIATTLGALAWKLLQKQVPGAQNGNFNKGNPQIRGFSDCYFFVSDTLQFGGPGQSGALFGGWVSRPDSGTMSRKLMDTAVSIRNGLLNCANESYDWHGNLNMKTEACHLPNDGLIRHTKAQFRSNENGTSETSIPELAPGVRP